MSRRRPKKARSEASVRQDESKFRPLMPAMFWLAAGSIVGLALVEIWNVEAPVLRWGFMAGIGLAGTVAILIQAKRKCPQCGTPYGYRPRLFKSSKCRNCGAEFPPWPNDR